MDLKKKQALCNALLLLDDEEEIAKKKKSKAKHLGETVAPKKGWTRNLQQSFPRIIRSKITQRLY